MGKHGELHKSKGKEIRTTETFNNKEIVVL